VRVIDSSGCDQLRPDRVIERADLIVDVRDHHRGSARLVGVGGVPGERGDPVGVGGV
jgi:hypothetical protein